MLVRMTLILVMLVIPMRMTLMQGEVISEWLDVDEVEEAFAKMRRAAGVRIVHLQTKINESLLRIKNFA